MRVLVSGLWCWHRAHDTSAFHTQILEAMGDQVRCSWARFCVAVIAAADCAGGRCSWQVDGLVAELTHLRRENDLLREENLALRRALGPGVAAEVGAPASAPESVLGASEIEPQDELET